MTTFALTTFAAALLGQVGPAQCTGVVSLDGEWSLATDTENAGRDQQWWRGPTEGARPTPVPWIIQEVFVGYHGVAWYWRDFDGPVNPHPGGRYVLRFYAVDYLCDVYLNDVHVGSHEGAEEVFELDVTGVLEPAAANRLAVRVLNPTYEPIDGIGLLETPHRNKAYPYTPGADFNYGGITDSVELLVTPEDRISDLFVRADPTTGDIRVSVEAFSLAEEPHRATIEVSVAPAAEGTTLATASTEVTLAPGSSYTEVALRLPEPRLWTLSDPFLYRVTARLRTVGSNSLDERSVRTGFRDFRFERGAFRLNGRRLYLRCSHTGADTPIGVRVPFDLGLLRRDLLNVKAMGFNAIRFIAGVAHRRQLDLADEIGLLVYEECFAAWVLGDSPLAADRFDRATAGMVRRDRNHPSVVIWGLLNETARGPVFEHAVGSLPLVRSLDDTRMVLLNSGRWDSPEPALSTLTSWRLPGELVPSAIHNPGPDVGKRADSTWQPRQLALHPGVKGERAAILWRAPASSDYSISARFTGIAAKPTTSDVHVLRGATEAFSALINLEGQGNEAESAFRADLMAGDTVMVVVGIGGNDPYSDTTAIELRIDSAEGAWDAEASFTAEANPNGLWEYGWMAADAPMSPESFRRFDTPDSDYMAPIGSLSNPGSPVWENVLADIHCYPRVPHTGAIYEMLRTMASSLPIAGEPAMQQPVFLSEYGIGSAVDLCRMVRNYEPLSKTHVEDAQTYGRFLDAFLADYEAWRLDEAFAGPEDYFRQCLAKMGRQRSLGMDAIRANPNIVGYSLTGTQDQALTGEGLTTQFRELKPGTVDALFEALAPLRMCAFAEPATLYRGGSVRLEVVLANEDVLSPGDYSLRVQLVAPDGTRILDQRVTLTVPAAVDGTEPPFAIPAHEQEVVVDGPSGRYRFVATLERGGAATGGEAEVHVYDPVEMPPIGYPPARLGDDPGLDGWLAEHGATWSTVDEAPLGAPILVSGACPQDPEAWRRVSERIQAGAVAVVLTPASLARGGEPLGWLPTEQRGATAEIRGWLYLKDEWAKRHPIFDGLPAGGLMDSVVYREIIPDLVLVGQPVPREAVAGAFKTSQGYEAGLTVAVHDHGMGRIVLNTLNIRERLGVDPVAERLLRNMLRYAAEAGR